MFRHFINVSKRSVSTAPKKLLVESKYNSKSSPSNFKPKKIEPGVYYQPSPSIPSPLQKTPSVFLPNSDPRKAAAVPEYSAEDVSYMPPLSTPTEKQYHLTAEQIEEIQQLRQSDPYKYTRKTLAQMYQCSEFFIGLVADNTEARIKDMAARLETIKSMWSPKRRDARLDRQKRKQAWYSSA